MNRGFDVVIGKAKNSEKERYGTSFLRLRVVVVVVWWGGDCFEGSKPLICDIGKDCDGIFCEVKVWWILCKSSAKV